MNRLQLLLTKLAEECTEVAQIALKTQQFGLAEKRKGQPLSNMERVHEELNDLLGVVQMLNDEFDFNFKPNAKAMIAKAHKVNRYAKYSIELGEVIE